MLPPAIHRAHTMPSKRLQQPESAPSHGSTAVAEFLEKAAEFDRQAAEAQRPSQKQHCASMAKAYRFLAEQQAIVDEQLASNQTSPIAEFAAAIRVNHARTDSTRIPELWPAPLSFGAEARSRPQARGASPTPGIELNAKLRVHQHSRTPHDVLG